MKSSSPPVASATTPHKTLQKNTHGSTKLQQQQQTGGKKRQKIESPEEKLAHRRMQYRAHQRHHRAKQKKRLDNLQHEVYALDQEIHELYYRMEELVQQQKSKRLHDIWEGHIAQSVKGIFQRFYKGYDSIYESFLNDILADNVEVMGIHGKEEVISRLVGLTGFELECETLQVLAPEDFVIVLAQGTLEIQGGDHASLFKHLVPSIIRDNTDSQANLTLPFKASFFFDQDGEHGLITKITYEIDYVSSLAKTLLSRPSKLLYPSMKQNSQQPKGETRREHSTSTTESQSPLHKLELKFVLS